VLECRKPSAFGEVGWLWTFLLDLRQGGIRTSAILLKGNKLPQTAYHNYFIDSQLLLLWRVTKTDHGNHYKQVLNQFNDQH
jgi:hypothetical protein